jgi:8-oxo-dGTP pyrophosphatase MutT (NUDIX family)
MTKQPKPSVKQRGRQAAVRSGQYLFWLTWPAIWAVTRFQKNRTRVVVKAGNKVLLLQSWLGPRRWELPGGGLHAGEDPRQGAVRELAEEVGLKAKLEQLEELGVFRNLLQSGITIHGHAYLLKLPRQPEIQLQRREIVKATWLELDQLPAKGLDNGTREVINRAVHYLQS